MTKDKLLNIIGVTKQEFIVILFIAKMSEKDTNRLDLSKLKFVYFIARLWKLVI
ncbi:hypothetical protein [Clostridium estertheticum]|uniref:hypothetical protein n=1 Tax=Clostridium estertheticum TaxID=238834 RepID=UPI001C7DCEB7|nr:hypothetical protein [Clostridium estertheticum]MBX4264445.1 hypothetical protein [Clostridium estertheticum]WLC89287.1 hypothetical protein KTC95_03395 [Clostridium estertheticum]